MGERKGQNKYYPPDYDPKKGGLNKFRGTHALRERARKIHLGILIIRFEMPYNIWCDGCKNHIGMGVRYNAEKTKVGMYYSTPIYKFRMKCHLCDNHFEIQTDPGNLDYVILSGARRQENRWDPTQNEQVVPETKEVQKRLFDDAMYKLEHQAKDKDAGEQAKPMLEKLIDRNKTVWDDCYEANSKLRADFRTKKKELKALKDVDEKLLSKCSLDITLLPETQQDRQMAALMKLQSKSAYEREEEKRLDILLKPALPSATQTTFGGLKRQKALSTQLQYGQLGIKRKTTTECNNREDTSCNAIPQSTTTINGIDSTSNGDIHINSGDIHTTTTAADSPILVDLPKSLALVCDYASSNSSLSSPSENDD
ncbi:coiled-coil domain-containing protein 130 homolog [Haematobia irritans]|uniref:coiled-coil domain-containing protein 130 homolog n=1 Tax=Haematobia irritans TaxID=7368 RepID=UPI003F508DD8